MRVINGLIAVSSMVGLAACSNPGTPPQTTSETTSTAPSSQAQNPQPTGSLPQGATVSAPISSPAGAVSTKTIQPDVTKRRGQ